MQQLKNECEPLPTLKHSSHVGKEKPDYETVVFIVGPVLVVL